MNKRIALWMLFTSLIFNLTAQSIIRGTVKGLNDGDSAIIRIQKSSEQFLYKKIRGINATSEIQFEFSNIQNGKWALSIDAKGYLFPIAKVIELNNNTSSTIITLTKAPSDSNFSYQWQDDSSFVGHAQQAYINDKVEINILGKAEKVPDDFNAINLLNEYGFFLSDSLSTWTSEDAYRLYQTVKKLNFQKFGETDSVKVKVVWQITDAFVDKDIDFITRNDIIFIKISRAAFTYASPLVVTVDGVKGKFFSKRLYNALVYYYTDKGTLKHRMDEIAKTRYGIEFLEPSDFLKKLMNETETNFQAFTSEEKLIILSMFEEFPDAMQRQEQLKYLVRRVNGQKHPVYPDAPAIAWVTNQNIEWMESAFKGNSIEYMQRLVLHEKVHFLWEHTFDTTTKKDWTELGGWFLDPTSNSGWSTSNTTEFVSAYAHLKNPNEDMAESVATYISNPEALRSRSLKKFEFIRDRIMQGSRFVSVIRPDLTFTVYNLYPDFNYPGKIKRTKLEVFGKADEDKRVVLEIELNIVNKNFDGAEWASGTFFSSIGTLKGMHLTPINQEKSILRGEIILSKLAKSGYWIVPQIQISDPAGNKRLENNSTYGLKCFINNPLEDITAPLYVQKSLRLDSVSEKFIDLSGYLAIDRCGTCADTLSNSTALRLTYNILEKNKINPDGRAYATIYFPTIDSSDKYNLQPYSKGVQINGKGILNDYVDSVKKAVFYFPIPDYYPSGYYSVSHLAITDQALNTRNILLDLDTANKNWFAPPNFIIQREIRDSFYFKTKYPDYKAPILDINDITIRATPTNPNSPNGETKFEMWLWIKDTSDFLGKASGFRDGIFTLRDPQGLERTYNIIGNGSSFTNIFSDSSIYGYKQYYTSVVLPVGSPPGLWGVSSITINDQAYNQKKYNFVEIVRFDVEESKILKVIPYVEITGKKVNMFNADSASAKIGCKSCKEQNYRLRMYSSMGGNSVVFEGKMTSDTIELKNLKLSGVNDGVLYATVFILDSSKALIGTGKSIYTKDTKAPTSQKLQTNLSNFGKSNLDSLIIQIESDEQNGSFEAVLLQKSIASNSVNSVNHQNIRSYSSTSVGDSIVLSGKYTNGKFNFNMNALKNMNDGLITIKFYLIDSLDNKATAITKDIYKDTKDPVISIKQAITNKLTSNITLTTNESVFNSLDSNSLVIKNGTFKSIKKIDTKNFEISIERTCSDSLFIDVKTGVLLDTVGNKNILTSLAVVESIVPQIPILSDVNVCQNDKSILKNTPTTGNNFKWYTTETGGIGDSTPPILNTSTAGSINYFVSQVSLSGCESKRVKLKVTVNALPTKPIISWNGSELSAPNTYSSYLWLQNNVVVANATLSLYKPTTTGQFRVVVTNTSGCSDTSEVYNLIVTSATNNISPQNSLSIYPNPANDFIILDLGTIPTKPVNIQLLDNTGRLLLSWILNQRLKQLDISKLPKGVYLLQISSGKNKVVQKIIK